MSKPTGPHVQLTEAAARECVLALIDRAGMSWRAGGGHGRAKQEHGLVDDAYKLAWQVYPSLSPESRLLVLSALVFHRVPRLVVMATRLDPTYVRQTLSVPVPA